MELPGEERERGTALGERVDLARETFRVVPVVVVPLGDEFSARERDREVSQFAQRAAGRRALDRRAQAAAPRDLPDCDVERRVAVVHDDEFAVDTALTREVGERRREVRQRRRARDGERAQQHRGEGARRRRAAQGKMDGFIGWMRGERVRASAILTYRDGAGGARRANLDAVVAWLLEAPGHEVIVVEQDVHPRLEAPMANPAARVVFAFNPGRFNRSWGLNVGARHANGGVLLFGEHDVVVPGGLAAAAGHCAASVDLVKPYRTMVGLTPDETRLVHERGGRALPAVDAGAGRGHDATDGRSWLCDGWFAIRRDAFAAIGTFDERFADSAGSSFAMTAKVELARLATCELDPGPALRLWSPEASGEAGVAAQDASDSALPDDYVRCDVAALAQLAAIQRQLHGRRDKYVPGGR